MRFAPICASISGITGASADALDLGRVRRIDLWLALNRALLAQPPRKHERNAEGALQPVLALDLARMSLDHHHRVRPVAGITAPLVLTNLAGIAPAPLLPGEAEVDYIGVAARIVAAAQPTDAIEEFLTRDVIDLTWEILRLRRVKAGLLRTSTSSGVSRVMVNLGYDERKGFGSARRLGESWATGDKSAKNEVTAALEKAQLSIEDVTAEALESKIDSFERLDRMLSSAEARRNNALREIDRHREALGAAMRQAVDEVQDAEFRDVETGEVSGGTPP